MSGPRHVIAIPILRSEDTSPAGCMCPGRRKLSEECLPHCHSALDVRLLIVIQPSDLTSF
jgi:hypothetical protein